MTKLEKIRFLLDELKRQLDIYDLDIIMVIGDKEQETHTTFIRGNESDLMCHLGHLLKCLTEDNPPKQTLEMQCILKQILKVVFKEETEND